MNNIINQDISYQYSYEIKNRTISSYYPSITGFISEYVDKNYNNNDDNIYRIILSYGNTKYIITIKNKTLISIDDEPAVVCINNNTKVRECEYWLNNGNMHRDKGPARITRYENGKFESLSWYKNGLLHRKDKPALITFLKDRTFSKKPKVTMAFEWYENNVVHRENGPAYIEYTNMRVRSRKSYKYRKIVTKKREMWYNHSKLHREDGPAIINYKNNKISMRTWWIDDVHITREHMYKVLGRRVRDLDMSDIVHLKLSL